VVKKKTGACNPTYDETAFNTDIKSFIVQAQEVNLENVESREINASGERIEIGAGGVRVLDDIVSIDIPVFTANYLDAARSPADRNIHVLNKKSQSDNLLIKQNPKEYKTFRLQ
jgi:hypothetical protein